VNDAPSARKRFSSPAGPTRSPSGTQLAQRPAKRVRLDVAEKGRLKRTSPAHVSATETPTDDNVRARPTCNVGCEESSHRHGSATDPIDLSNALNRSFQDNSFCGSEQSLGIVGNSNHTPGRIQTSDAVASTSPTILQPPPHSDRNISASSSSTDNNHSERQLVTIPENYKTKTTKKIREMSFEIVKLRDDFQNYKTKSEKKQRDMSHETLKLRDGVEESRSVERQAQDDIRQLRNEITRLRESHDIQANKFHAMEGQIQHITQATQNHSVVISQSSGPNLMSRSAPNQIVVNSDRAFSGMLRAICNDSEV
jgi:TolA-binding protein